MKNSRQYYAKLPKKLQTIKNDFYKMLWDQKPQWFALKKEKTWSELKRDFVNSVQDLEDAMAALEAFFQRYDHFWAEHITWLRERNTFYHLKRMKTKMKYESKESIESLKNKLDELWQEERK